jgi:hypothetical protein
VDHEGQGVFENDPLAVELVSHDVLEACGVAM